MYIDPHVHCRDWKQAHKETIAHALKVAESVGVSAIFDMPNTNPIITSRELARERLELAKKANSPVFYGLYMGLTSNPSQIKEAVNTYKEFPEIVGLKLFAGHSVGDLAVIKEKQQRLVYNTLAELNYTGMLVVHCEKESFMYPELFNPKEPITHCYARPREAELESILDQIQHTILSKFEGNLHITHISVPESVELVQESKGLIRISCSTTPHHCLLDNSLMKNEGGILYKVNPPLRTKEDSSKILEYLRNGKIDYLETDHAPHTLEEKIKEPFMSGLPVLPFIPFVIEQLRQRGFTEEKINEITYKRIIEMFRIKIEERELRTGGDYSKDYAFNPYESLM